MNPLHIIFLLFFIFGLQIAIHSEPPKQVSIQSKFIANSSKSEPEILAAPMITTLPGQEAIICIVQEKRSEGGDKKNVDGIRTRVKVLETTKGLLIQGYAFVGIHNPEKLDQEIEILGLFEDQPTRSDQNIADDWINEIQLSGTFRIRGKAYASLSTPEGNFWVEEGKFASGYKLIKLDLSKSQPSGLIRKGEKEGWVGLRLGTSLNQMDMTRSFKDGGVLFIKKYNLVKRFLYRWKHPTEKSSLWNWSLL
jgi:hypothetical protein